MRRNRVLASLITVALAVVSIGTATAWFSDSATIRFEISAADDFDGDDGGKVWVCKLTGPPDDARLKPGENPIRVSADSLDAEEGFSDTHPSYVVEHGNVICAVPEVPPIDSPQAVPITPEPGAIETPAEGAAPPDPTTTTSTVAETTTSSSPTSTSTTTSSIPAPTTTTAATASTSFAPEEPTTTTSTDPGIDE